MKRLLFCGLLAVILALGGATVPRLQREGVASTLDTSGIAWLRSLPLDEWQRIDNGDQGIERVRWLFDSIINQARIQMALEADGGAFEHVLRRYIFYFHPEYEYWFPPYPDDHDALGNPIADGIEKQVKWPVWVKKKKVSAGKPYDEYYAIHLGRKHDDERDIYVKFKDQELYDLKVMRWRYLPGVEGPPKVEELKMRFDVDIATLTRTYYNDNRSWEVYQRGTLMVFERGNPAPVVARVKEPELEIGGAMLLFDLPVGDESGIANDRAFQVFRGLINLARLQLGMIDEGGAFEKYLRKDFFYYYPWEPWYESVDVEHLSPRPDEGAQEQFLFKIGDEDTARKLWVSFSRSSGNPEQGILRIKLQRYLPGEGTSPPKTEVRMFIIDMDRETPVAIYGRGVRSPDWTIATEEPIAAFTQGNPSPIAPSAELTRELQDALEEELVSFDALLEGLQDEDADEELRLAALQQLREIAATEEIDLSQQERLVLALFEVYQDIWGPDTLRDVVTKFLKDAWTLKGRKVDMSLINQIKDRLSDALMSTITGSFLASSYAAVDRNLLLLSEFIDQYGGQLERDYLGEWKDYLMSLFCKNDEDNLTSRRIMTALASIGRYAFGEEILEFIEALAEGRIEEACGGRS